VRARRAHRTQHLVGEARHRLTRHGGTDLHEEGQAISCYVRGDPTIGD
jgi:hypothetical protein